MFFTKHITDLNFDEEIFFYGLLPPMIFAGGYNLKKDDFEKNFKYIFLFGFLGTVTAFGVIFGLTYLIDTLEWIVPIGEPVDYEYMDVSLIVKYSATISATDSVAALTLINPAQYPKLFSIIFGEGDGQRRSGYHPVQSCGYEIS
jgi:NhaP-type Na+/H+ or K+/H+ antiporter